MIPLAIICVLLGGGFTAFSLRAGPNRSPRNAAFGATIAILGIGALAYEAIKAAF